MRILIVGAGKVGTSVAESLVSESNDITIVDSDKDRISDIQSHLDLQGIVGDASSPLVLAEAGAADVDMLIAVTANDETNLATTLIAAELFNVPSRIARVRNSELREYPGLLSTNGFRATSVIWPEQAVTNYILKLVTYPETLQVIEFSSNEVVLIAVKAMLGSSLVDKPVKLISEILPGVSARVVSIYRQKGRRIDVDGDTIIGQGDEVFVLVSRKDVRTVVSGLRYKGRKSQRVMIAGGGNLGLQLAKALDSGETETGEDYNVKIIDASKRSCQYLSQNLSSDVLVLNGEMTDENLFVSEGIANIDLFIAVSNDDENNIMSCLLAKKLGAHRAIALINRRSYVDLIEGTSIDIAISPTEATLSDLLRHIRHGDVVSAHTLRRGGAEVLEIVAHGSKRNSQVIGRAIEDIDLPEDATIGCLLRSRGGENQVIMATHDLVIDDGDQVIVFVGSKRQIPEVEKLFAPSVGFF